MNVIDDKSAIAVLGGTFDPIHHGHLRLAIDLAEKLDLQQVRLMPGFQPVHRERPSATAMQRLAMLQLAVLDNSELKVDDRELQRKGPSYTLLSIQELRAEIGLEVPIYFILGEDAFSYFDTWHEWQQLINYAHLLIAVRPGNHPELSNELRKFVNSCEYQGQGYPSTPSGSLLWIDNVKLEISSSDIRERVKDGKNIRYLLPHTVYQYIEQHKIYR